MPTDQHDDITPILATPDQQPAAPAVEPAPPAPEPLSPKVRDACDIARGFAQPDPAAEPAQKRGAWRDVNSRGNGSESYCRRLPAGETTWLWVSDERLPHGTFLASDRQAVCRGEVYPGDLLATYSRSLRGGKSQGKATLDGFELFAGRNAEGKLILPDCVAKKRRDGKYSVILPSGHELIVESPDW